MIDKTKWNIPCFKKNFNLWAAYEWTWDIADFFCENDSQSPLTLYGPNSFFRRFSGHNLR